MKNDVYSTYPLAQKALRFGAAGMLRRQAQDLVSKAGAY
jgi:hypothetical protein